MSAEEGRLPSFKAPRDLTLTSQSPQPQAQSRQKRVFKPNIPPKRDRTATTTTATPSTSTQASSSTPPQPEKTRPPRRTPNLIQSTSVFCEGIGEATRTTRHSNRQPSVNPRGGGGGGKSSRSASTVTRESLNKIIKDEPSHSSKIDLNELFECPDEKEVETNPAVTVPLTNHTKESKPQLIFMDQTGPPLLFQLPSHLPVLLPEEQKLTENISTLPEGAIGKIQILSSGRVQFLLGENIFNVNVGKKVGFRQDLVSLNIENLHMKELGTVFDKLVLTPDLDLIQ